LVFDLAPARLNRLLRTVAWLGHEYRIVLSAVEVALEGLDLPVLLLPGTEDLVQVGLLLGIERERGRRRILCDGGATRVVRVWRDSRIDLLRWDAIGISIAANARWIGGIGRVRPRRLRLRPVLRCGGLDGSHEQCARDDEDANSIEHYKPKSFRIAQQDQS